MKTFRKNFLFSNNNSLQEEYVMIRANTLEQEFLNDLIENISRGEIIIEEDSSLYFDLIENNFPIDSGRPDWEEIPHTLFDNMSAENRERVLECLEITKNELSLSEETNVVIIGDGILEVALKMSFHTLLSIASELFSLPQHTYIIPQDASWCINYTFEDDLYFGYAPK